MSAEDPRLQEARLKAAVLFFGPEQRTMREALEGAGFKVSSRITEKDWTHGPQISQSWKDRHGNYDPSMGACCFVARLTATRCRSWLLGLPEEWEQAEGAYEQAKARLLNFTKVDALPGLSVRCDDCNACPGARCRTKAGKVGKVCHPKRIKLEERVKADPSRCQECGYVPNLEGEIRHAFACSRRVS